MLQSFDVITDKLNIESVVKSRMHNQTAQVRIIIVIEPFKQTSVEEEHGLYEFFLKSPVTVL